MLDPMFGELLDLAEPAVARTRHEAYSRHIERLIGAVEEHYQGKTLAGFLARVLRRSWRENRRLAHYATRDPLTGLVEPPRLRAHLRAVDGVVRALRSPAHGRACSTSTTSST